MPTTWLVEYHAEAVEELAKLRDARQRKGAWQLAILLRQKGPRGSPRRT